MTGYAQRLKILIVSSEMYPFARIGGLGDVVASLAASLRARGHDVRVVMPFYRAVKQAKARTRSVLEAMGVWMGNVEEWCRVREASFPANVPVYFVEHDLYFDREGFYHDEEMRDYGDNPRRFAFLCRAALQLCRDVGFTPHVVHVNDWQTALGAAYLKVWHWNDPLLGKTASLLTVHNAAYQGVYPKTHYDYLGLGWQNFTPEIFEQHGEIGLLKGSISFSDMIVAVSPTFAREIQTDEGGFGLAPLFAGRGDDCVGIVNGIDYSVWNPATDPMIPAHFSAGDISGKRRCKESLQEKFSLSVDPAVPVIGAVGRFVEQKGFGLVTRIIERVLDGMAVQFVILGSGEHGVEEYFKWLPSRYPGRAGSFIGFDDSRAHLINAGCDFFIMPSQWEPCGLNQMYAQRYGTIPIARAVGGLDDTIDQYDETSGSGTGYKFHDFSPNSLYDTIGWAVSTFYDRKDHHLRMVEAAMRRDFSWESSTTAYEQAYARAVSNKRAYDARQKRYYQS